LPYHGQMIQLFPNLQNTPLAALGTPKVVAESLPDRLLPMLWLFVKQRPWSALLLCILPLFNRTSFATIGFATKKITDAVLAVQATPALIWQTVSAPFTLFVVAIVGVFFFSVLQWILSYRTRLPTLADMRVTIFAFVQRHSSNYFENTLSGKVAHKTVVLPEQMVWLLEFCWFQFMPAIGFFLAVSFYFFTASPAFAAIILVWLAVYFGVCTLTGRLCAKLAGEHNDAKTAVTGRIIDAMVNIRNVIQFAGNSTEDNIVRGAVHKAWIAQRRVYLAVVLLMRTIQHTLNIGIWIILYAGALYALSHQEITVGDFVMITSLGSLLIMRAQEFAEVIPEFFDYLGSARENIETLIVKRDISDRTDAKVLAVNNGTIEFRRVNFSYDNKTTIFKDLSLLIPAGQRVGLIGPSGAGKTTITTILQRLQDIQGGEILIDGQNIAAVKQESLRRNIGIIPQDTVLFHRNLIDNIRYGRPEASEDEVIEAARHANADEFIRQLPKAYQTMVGERGVKLSGGQRQRIAIARALLKNAPILLLDEATSALDSESEAAIQHAMLTAMRGRTVIAIAHRLSTIAHLDRLIVLQNGQIVEDGTHQELLAKGGLYAALWRKQSGGFLADPADAAVSSDDNQPAVADAAATSKAEDASAKTDD
jgi:ATP-binding cassette, subfamily B, bacterial